MSDKLRTTILNVDDDDASRYAVSRVLRQAGFEVTEAASGAETLRLVKENPDLVILDVNLPDMSGFEVCRRIKADPATSLIPVLHLSATYVDDQSMVIGLATGADGYLTHPVEPSVLIATVKALLRVRRAEAELQAAAQQWRATFDAIGDGVWLLDRERRVLRCNQAALDILGKPFSDIIGRTCWELAHGTSEPIEGCPFVRMRDTRRRESLVLPMGDRWFNVAVDPLLDDVKNLIGAVHIMTDITERRRAEEALWESEQRYRQLFEGVGDAVIVYSSQGRFVDCNEATLHRLGYSREEFLCLGAADIVHPDFYHLMKDNQKQIWAGEATVVESAHCCKDGRVIPVEVNARRIEYQGESAVLAVVRDITERKRAEEELRKHREHLEELVDERTAELRRSNEQLQHEITERKRAEEQLRWQSAMLDGINKLLLETLTSESDEEVARICLTMAEGLTGSKFGFICEVNQVGRFDTIAISDPGWEVCRIPKTNAVLMLEDLEIRGIRGRAVKDERSMIFNDPASHPDWVGAPEGHPPITSFLGVPLKHAGKTFGMIGLANKESGYDLADQQAIETLSVAFVEALNRKRADEALQRSLEQTARGQRLLLALSQAAQAVQRARTPDEVYRTVVDEVSKLGYNAAIFTLIDDRAHLAVPYLTFEPNVLWAAEKLTGLSVQGYRFPLVLGGLFHRIIIDGETTFTESPSELIAEALPRPVRPLAGRVEALLGIEQGIIAPLAVGGETNGLLVVAGTDLTKADVSAVTAFANQTAIALENAQLLEAITKHRRDLERLSTQIINTQEAERKRISRELHDELGQTLTGLKLLLDMSTRLPTDEVTASLDEAQALVNELITSVRGLSLDLRPAMLDDLGLLPALAWHFDRYTAQTHVRVTFKHSGLEGRFAPEVETAAYRIVQEVLTNVARHADVSQVMVRLWTDQDTLGVQIEDQGTGFDAEATLAAGATTGLAGMRERAVLLGGRLTVESAPGAGTRVTAELPLGGPVEDREER